VEPTIRQQLLDLNRAFYDRFARPFADSRNPAQDSLHRALNGIAEGNAVLDVGCGDGRVARLLDRRARPVEYLGIDASPALIALARTRAAALSCVTASFAVQDVTHPDWPDQLERSDFNFVLALALLHHIPGHDLRVRLVQQLAGLLNPEGTAILSTWQFLASERLRRKIVPWATVGLRDDQVEPGDYLLDWRRGGYGLRYCHWVDEDESRELCQAAGLQVQESFLADDGLSLYVVAGR
jgi:tRNA (uracil-5-)-methyltransferase TRM9